MLVDGHFVPDIWIPFWPWYLNTTIPSEQLSLNVGWMPLPWCSLWKKQKQKQKINASAVSWYCPCMVTLSPGGTSWFGMQPDVWNPLTYPYRRIFFSLKKWIIWCFFFVLFCLFVCLFVLFVCLFLFFVLFCFFFFIYFFFLCYCNLGPISKGFSTSKTADIFLFIYLFIFFLNFS